MRTKRRATPIVIATALALGVVGLTGCGTPSSPSVPKAATATAPTTAAPSKAAPTTKALEPGSVAVPGYEPARVATAARFAEDFALAAMSGCSPQSLPALQALMTPAMYKAAMAAKPFVLDFEPPTIMSPGCITSQKLSDGDVSPGDVVEGMPSIRVAVTVTEGLNVSTTTSPKTLEPITVARRYTVEVVASGTGWLVNGVDTSDSTIIDGK